MATLNGGDKLQKRLAEIAKKLESAKSVSAGLHEGAKYPTGVSVALVGTTHEYGSAKRGIPARPWMRPAIRAKAKAWGDVIASGLSAENYDASRVLALTGEVMKSDIQESIRAVDSPPLKPMTVKRKGFAKPLIDTSVMLHHVDYEVNE